jgi:glucokinase
LALLTKGLTQNEATILGKAIHAGDSHAKHIFESTTDDLAFALSHAIHLFHPDIVVLGGGLSLLGEILRSAVETKTQNYVMDAFRPGLNIQLAALKEDAVTIGAIAMAMRSNII